MDELRRLLEKLGLNADTIDKITKKELSVDDAYQQIKSEQKNLIVNDNQFVNTIKAESQVEFTTGLNKTIKKLFDLSPEEMHDKKIGDLLEYGRDKLSQKLIDTYKDANDRRLMTELDNIKKILKDKETELERVTKEVLPGVEAKAQDQVETYKKHLALERYIESFPIQTSLELIFPGIRDSIEAHGYRLKFGPDKKLQLINQDGTTPMNEDKSKFINLTDFITTKLKTWGALKVSNAPAPVENGQMSVGASPATVGGQPKVYTGPDAGSNKLQGISKIDEKLANYKREGALKSN